MSCETGKEGRGSYESALSCARYRETKCGHEVNVYQCRLCGKWHLTKFPVHLLGHLPIQRRATA